MNKKLLLTLLISSIYLASFAQVPTLTGPNISPALNDSFISVACDTTGILPGNSGVSQNWDFHALAPTTLAYPIDTGHVVYATAAPGYSLISLVPGFAASHAVVSPSTNLTTYYQEGSSRLSSSAVYVDMNNNAVYSNPMDVFQFPFTYGSNFTDPYYGAITYLGTTGTEAGNVTVNGDAYGTLTLPPVPPSSTNAVYGGVLRVHSFQSFRDSTAIFGVVQTDTLETYTWYLPGYHTALLTISTLRGTGLHNKVVSYAQRQIANHEYVAPLDLAGSLQVYPNPAVYNITIRFNTDGNSRVRVSLVDVIGRETAVISDAKGPQNISYNVSSLAKGIYLLRLQSEGKSVVRRIEIQ